MTYSTSVAERRRLNFSNLVGNELEVEQVMAASLLSAKDIMDDFTYVGRKINEYRFRRAIPPMPCGSLSEAIKNKFALLETLGKLGDKYLTGDFLLAPVVTQTIDKSQGLREAARKTRVTL